MPDYNSEIAKVLAHGRAELKSITNETAQGILAAYKAGVDDIQSRYADLADKAAQGNVGADTARKMLLPIKKQAELDMANWAAVASGQMDAGNAKSFLAGCGFAAAVGDAKNITFRLGTSDRMAFQAAYAATQSGPLRDLLSGIAKTTVDDAALAVRNSILASEGSKKMSKRLQAATTGSAARCDLIARTEVARAYREATLLSYEQMGVNYIKWESAEQTQTCSACWALDGHIYEMGKVPGDHPRGRCKLMALSDTEVEELKAEHGENWQDGVYKERVAQNTATLKQKPQSELELIFGSKKQADIFTAGAPLQAAARIASNSKWGPSVQKRVFQNLSHAQELAESHAAKIAQQQAAALAQAEAAAAQAAHEAAVAAQKVKDDYKAELEKLTSTALKAKAKGGAVKNWQWATKQELIDIMSDADPAAVAKAHESIAMKHEQWVIAQKLNKAKAKDVAAEAAQEAAQAAQAAEDALQAEIAAKAAHEAAVAQAKAAAHQAEMEAIKKAKMEAEAAAAKAEAEALAKQQAEADAKAKAQAIKAEKAEKAKAKKLAAQAQAKLEADAAAAKLEAEAAAAYAKVEAEKAAAVEAKAAKTAATKAAKAAKKAAIDLDKAAAQNVEAQAEANGKKSAAKMAAEVKTDATPAPAPKPAAAHNFAEIDAFWEANHGNDRWKRQGAAQLGGMHAKDIYVDADGARWLFKPEKLSPWRCEADEVAYKIGRLINPDAIEVRAVKLDGVTGTIQKLETKLAPKADFNGVPVQTLTMSEKNQVLSEQVTDWLVGNHDSHSENFLRLTDGRVLGIDKGQAFKFIGDDSLAIDYNPNYAEPLYNTLLKAAKQGAIEVDPNALLPAIRAVEAITDDEYKAMLRKYASGRFAGKPAMEEDFYNMALARKNSIRADFEKLYADATNTPGFTFEAERVQAKPAAADVAAPISDKLADAVSDAKKIGWQGKAISMDGADIEDQNALVYILNSSDGPRTVVKLKIRPEADQRIVDTLRKMNPDMKSIKPNSAASTENQDAYSADILAAVKTINTHAADGKYNQSKLDKVFEHMNPLYDMFISGSPEEKKMAEFYIGWIKAIGNASSDNKPISEIFSPYVAPVAKTKSKAKSKVPLEDILVARTGPVSIPKTKVTNGEIYIVDEGVSNYRVFNANHVGVQYDVDLGDGAFIRYKPWSDDNLYTQGGEMEVVVPGNDPKAVEKALARAKVLGINTDAATPADRELLYLTKAAAINLEHQDPAYKKVIADLDKKKASTEERVDVLRGYWNKKLNVPDVRELPAYNPAGTYDKKFDGSAADAGMVQQYRFDLSEADVKRDMAGYSVYHGLTNGSGYARFFSEVLPGSGALVSTAEKARIGVPVGGMSPEADMRTGGANYVFTRIRKQPKKGAHSATGLYFKTDLMRRMDAITYDHDAFGRVTADYTNNRKSGPEAWIKASQTSSSNETIFKNSITLVDNLEWVVVSNASERKACIQAFADNGITVLPDGRKVADIILIGS